MHNFTHSLTAMGTVGPIDATIGQFQLTCRNGDVFTVSVSAETAFHVLRNLDELDRDRVLDPTTPPAPLGGAPPPAPTPPRPPARRSRGRRRTRPCS